MTLPNQISLMNSMIKDVYQATIKDWMEACKAVDDVNDYVKMLSNER